VLDEEGLQLEDWHVRGLKLKGARRALRIPLGDVEARYDEGLLLSFSLPPGCYATVVLRELQKLENQAYDDDDGDDGDDGE